MPMGLDTVHEQYGLWALEWQKCRDVIAGQRALWARSTGDARGYLPELKKQSTADYESYKRRPAFYNATSVTVDAWGGAIFRRDPETLLSDTLTEDFDNIDLAGTPFDTFAAQVINEVLDVGRHGVLLDWPKAEEGTMLDPAVARPYWCRYCAEDILDWDWQNVGGQWMLTYVKLRECLTYRDPGNEFLTRKTMRYRILDLESGIYRQREYEVNDRGVEMQMGEVYPKRGSEPLTWIPFKFFGSLHTQPEIQKPLVLDLVDLNLAHWRLLVDYFHGLHFAALPTHWLADVPPDPGKDVSVGPGEVWALSPDGRCGILEFTGQGLRPLETALAKQEERMAHMGAEVLMPDKKAAETAEAMRIRAAGRNASLTTVANTGSWGFTKLAQWHSWWRGEVQNPEDSDASITLNTRFTAATMTAQELTALVAARQANEISRRTFLENLFRGEILEGRTVDEELIEVETEADAAAEREQLRQATETTRTLGNAMLERMNAEDQQNAAA